MNGSGVGKKEKHSYTWRNVIECVRPLATSSCKQQKKEEVLLLNHSKCTSSLRYPIRIYQALNCLSTCQYTIS